MAITRRTHGTGHSYTVDGEHLPGVTTVLRMTPKPKLVYWASRTTAEYAVDHWNELARMRVSERLAHLRQAITDARDSGARRGTQVHRLAERWQAGEDVVPPEELRGHVESYWDFLDRLDVQAVAAETIVANRTAGYCGTFDLVADLAGERWMIDIKTARSGIFPETALQQCAYMHAEVYLAPDGTEQPMADLKVQRAGAVHVRADGWDLYPLDTSPVVWEYFQHVLWMYQQDDYFQTLVGEPVEVPAREAAL